MNETASIVLERTTSESPEKMWRALTMSNLTVNWLTANRGLVAGTAAGLVHCEVVERDEPRRLVYLWGNGAEADAGFRTVVTWTLMPTSAGTVVRLEHSGFRPQDERSHVGLSAGWPRIMAGLELLAAELD